MTRTGRRDTGNTERRTQREEHREKNTERRTREPAFLGFLNRTWLRDTEAQRENRGRLFLGEEN
jgi:hypothetical protein